MLKKHCYKILVVIWLIIIFLLSLMTIKENSVNFGRIPHIDKIVHFCFYFILAGLFLQMLEKEIFLFKGLIFNSIITFIVCFSIGSLIEYLQSNFTESRNGDIYDIVSNSFGTVIAILLTYLTSNIKKKKKDLFIKKNY